MAPKASSPLNDERPYRLSDAFVSEIKAEMGRQDITPGALARMIGVNKQYVSSRLTTGNPHTGKRVLLSLPDVIKVAEVLNLDLRELLDRAEAAAEIKDWDL
jgi:hypothetical protein